MMDKSAAKAGEFLQAMVDPRVEEARAAVRALLVPTGKDLEVLLINLHQQSAQSQRKARRASTTSSRSAVRVVSCLAT